MPSTSSGYAVAPLPMIALVSDDGDSAAANSAAGPPTSGPNDVWRSELPLLDQPDEERAHGLR